MSLSAQSASSLPKIPGGFGPFQRDPQHAGQIHERMQAKLEAWQAQNPGLSIDAFFVQMRAEHPGGGPGGPGGFGGRHEDPAQHAARIKSDYSQFITANPGATVEQFAQAQLAQRQQRMAARGIQLPQAAEGDFLQRMVGHIQQVLGVSV